MEGKAAGIARCAVLAVFLCPGAIGLALPPMRDRRRARARSC
jgi:hypothetical protein